MLCGVWVFYFSFFLNSLLSLSRSRSFLFFPYSVLSSSFSSLSFSSLSSLFPSRQQTLCKALINKREHPSLLLSPPSSLLLTFQGTKKKVTFYRNISGEEFIFITVLN